MTGTVLQSSEEPVCTGGSEEEDVAAALEREVAAMRGQDNGSITDTVDHSS